MIPSDHGGIKCLSIDYISCIVLVCVLLVLGTFTPNGYSAESFEVAGITEPVMSVTLSADQAGKLAKIFYKEGDHVKKGETIMELEKTMEELEVQRRRLIFDSKVELNTAIEQEKTLKGMLDATRVLFSKTKSVSKDEMEKLELDYKLAVGKRKQYEVAEKREFIEYNIALENLQRRILVAPVDCIITDLTLEVGETCEPRQPLVKIVDPSECFFVANMDEKVGRTLKKGMTVQLKIRTGDTDIERAGRVVYVAPVVDSASNLLEVKVKFNNSDRVIRPGVSGIMIVSSP